MPRTRGWLTAGTGLALWVAGRTFGSGSLEQVGFALVALVVIAMAVVLFRHEDLEVDRELVPPRTRAGQQVTVRLHLRNEGRRALPLVLLDDRVPPELAAHARFAISGVEAGGRRAAAYEIRPPRRGRYRIGPLAISYVDPFGLAATTRAAAATADLLVHPRIEKLRLPREPGTRRSTASSALRQLSGARGEDFYTMREYAQGDDLRKIHWPSTAKRGKPMIRQEETPWHTRTMILLDDDTGNAGGEHAAFERAVEAAASLADLYYRSAYTFRLLTSHDTGVEPGRGADHYHRTLDFLATVAPRPSGKDALVRRLAELETGTSAEGMLVIVTTALDATGATAITRSLRRFRQVITLLYPAHRFAPGFPARPELEGAQREVTLRLVRAGIAAVVLRPEQSLAAAWAALGKGPGRAGEGGEPWDPKHALA